MIRKILTLTRRSDIWPSSGRFIYEGCVDVSMARRAMSTRPTSSFSTISKSESPMLSIDTRKHTYGPLNQSIMIPHVTVPGKLVDLAIKRHETFILLSYDHNHLCIDLTYILHFSTPLSTITHLPQSSSLIIIISHNEHHIQPWPFGDQ